MTGGAEPTCEGSAVAAAAVQDSVNLGRAVNVALDPDEEGRNDAGCLATKTFVILRGTTGNKPMYYCSRSSF